MKLNDVDVKINEDLGDWVKRKVFKTGIAGQSRKLGAKQQEIQNKIYKTGLQYFKNQLSQSLDRAVKSGFVTTQTPTTRPQSISQATSTQQADQDTGVKVQSGNRIVIPRTGMPQYYKIGNKWFNNQNQTITKAQSIETLEKMADGGNAREEKIPENPSQPDKPTKTKQRESVQFEFLNMITESKILNEQESVGEFIRDFVGSQTDEFTPNQKYQNFINDSVKTAEQEYIKTGKISDKTYEQLWATIFNWSKLQRGSGRSGRVSYRANTDLNNNNIDDGVERERWKRKLSSELENLDLNDENSLNRAAEIARELATFVNQSRQNKSR